MHFFSKVVTKKSITLYLQQKPSESFFLAHKNQKNPATITAKTDKLRQNMLVNLSLK
jgi:hypothetical protein